MRTFVYDAENKQIEVLNDKDETIGEYFYDGDASGGRNLNQAI